MINVNIKWDTGTVLVFVTVTSSGFTLVVCFDEKGIRAEKDPSCLHSESFEPIRPVGTAILVRFPVPTPTYDLPPVGRLGAGTLET
jgi:hypothetical protein